MRLLRAWFHCIRQFSASAWLGELVMSLALLTIARLLWCIALVSGSRRPRGAPTLQCSTIQQEIHAHGTTTNSSLYFINISSFQRESTYTYTPGRIYHGEQILNLKFILLIYFRLHDFIPAVKLQSRSTPFVGFLVQASLFDASNVGRFLSLSSGLQYARCSTLNPQVIPLPCKAV